MTDRAAVALAVAAAAGALVGRGPSPWLGALLVVVALVTHRPIVVVIAAFVLAGGVAARADAGLVSPRPGPFEGWATMLTDPEASGSGVRADARLDDGRHLQAIARSGGGVHALRVAQAGERILVVGRLERPPPGATWLAARHVVGILAVDDIRARSAGAPWMRAANALRGLLVQGADGLPARQRPLFLGFVLGDTRGQPVDIADDFRGAGLSHLLAVSGQNVAFVLALAGPLLRRLGLRARLPATLTVIGFFALLTRFEPSVLRASAMAALAVTASTLGREASSARLLALAVTGLVLIDPFLVNMVGFQLSAGACVGIVCAVAGHRPRRTRPQSDRRGLGGHNRCPSRSRARTHCGVRRDPRRWCAGQPVRRTGGRTGDGLGIGRRSHRRLDRRRRSYGVALADASLDRLDRVGRALGGFRAAR
jgi:competence protein ComEC